MDEWRDGWMDGWMDSTQQARQRKRHSSHYYIISYIYIYNNMLLLLHTSRQRLTRNLSNPASRRQASLRAPARLWHSLKSMASFGLEGGEEEGERRGWACVCMCVCVGVV